MNLADLFTITSLTDAVNKLPAVPGKAGETGLFLEKGVTTTSVLIEQFEGRLSLVPAISRSEDPTPAKKGKRSRRTFSVPHLPVTAQLLPAEIQNIAAFGTDQPINGQASVINDKLQGMKASLEATREWQRIGAIAGQILDHDGSVIYDLFNEFGISKKTDTIKLSDQKIDVRAALLKQKRFIELQAPHLIITGFKSFCGADFFDALTGHDAVKAAYANWQAAQDRLGGDLRQGFVHGGIEFVEYNVQVSGKDFVPSKVARIFPIAQNMFRVYNAPANYNETVNTMGLPFYAKAEERKLGKGWDLEAQANPLAMCLCPEGLIELTAT